MNAEQYAHAGDDVVQVASEAGEAESQPAPKRARRGWGAITPHGAAPRDAGAGARARGGAPRERPELVTFRCEPYQCTLTAVACLLRVVQPALQRISCRSCEVGEAHRVGGRVSYDKHQKPTVKRVGPTPETWRDGRPVVRLHVLPLVSDRSDTSR